MSSRQRTSNPSRNQGMVLAIGFAVTVAMWAITYIALMSPGLAVGEVLFGLTLGCLVAGGYVVGRQVESPTRAAKVGAMVGLLSATLNLLLIGSVLREKAGQQRAGTALVWVASLYACSVGFASLGAWIGASHARRRGAVPPPERNWFFAFTCVAAATVFLLLITGGLVTGLEAGLAVPDWPNSFGHNMLLYPLSQMVGGVYYEHAHRLYGMLVGVTAITLTVAMFIFDQRGWLRALAAGYLFMVCFQGVLGGTRVTETSRTLAIVHGVFGQIVFATIASIAALSSTTWKQFGTESSRANLVRSDSPGNSIANAWKFDRSLSTTLVVMLVVQLALGALYRHLRREWDLGPEPVHVLYTHILVALGLLLVAIAAGGRAWGMHRDQPVLPALGRWILLLVAAQVVLGVVAMIVVWSGASGHQNLLVEVIVTTLHQATGALLLAMATLLLLWTRRILPTQRAEAPIFSPSSASLG
ncbi:MAG: COX15/CtaA family protein [Phycisphaerales bacterium]|nr:COX15/CtaA family protein [Phycisphaerales bacterium]